MDFQNILDTYARTRVHARRLQGQGLPVPIELTQFMRNVEESAATQFSPEQLKIIEHRQVRPLEQRIFQDWQAQSKERQIAEALRQRNARAQEDTKGMFGEKQGLDHEMLQNITKRNGDGRIKGTLKLPTSKAKIDWDFYEKTAKDFGPKFGVNEPTAKKFFARLDTILDAKNNNPERYESIAKNIDIPRERLDKMMDAWATESMGLGLAKRYAEKDKDLPEYEEVPVSDKNQIRAELVKNIHEAEDESGEEFGTNDIDPYLRKDAARETAELHHEIASQGKDTEGYMGTRDAIIRAMDQQEANDA